MKPIPLENSRTHPSFLALDRVSLGLALPEVSAHVSECEQCQGYLESLPQLSAAADFAAVQRAIERRQELVLWYMSNNTKHIFSVYCRL